MSTLGTLVGRSGFRTEPFRVKGPAGGVIQQVFTHSVTFAGTPTAGDAVPFVVPFDCKLVAACVGVRDNGSANDTNIKVWNGTVAAGTQLCGDALSVANDDATLSDSTDLTDSTFVDAQLDLGDVVTIEVDAIATDVDDVVVTLTFITR